ncbi:hypothetical protein B0T14DRAFT_421374, partial [Immersiella caudata]
FNGALNYDENGQLQREHFPGEDIWVGTPTPEMDALWDKLEAGSIILLDGEEADMVRDRTIMVDGYWVTGLDVFHQVHCLNQVRKALYPEYYPPTQSGRVNKLHWEHCLDYVRQAIMCNADISPVTSTWYETAQTFGPNFRTLHTCKNLDALLEWSLKRTTDARKGQGPGSETAKDPGMVVDGERGGLATGGHEHGHA